MSIWQGYIAALNANLLIRFALKIVLTGNELNFISMFIEYILT